MSEQCCGIQVGGNVCDFKMETYEPSRGDFGEVSLEAQKAAKKWTILFFYPADFTFVCSTEFAALAERHESFKELNADIITVSTDTKYVHLAWQREEKLLEKVKYSMGSDPTGCVSRMFGVYDASSGLALRGTFIVSPEGKLFNSEVNYYNLGRNVEELLRKIKANLHLAANPGEACPASWQKEGDKTLNPSAKMVGKVFEAMQ